MGGAYGHGSCVHAHTHRTRRGGLAVASVWREGRKLHADVVAYGRLIGPVQDIEVAELRALELFVENEFPAADGTLTYYGDCKWVLDTYD